MGSFRMPSIRITAVLLLVAGILAAPVEGTMPASRVDFDKGLAFLEAGDYRRAVAHFDALLEREPDNAEALSNRGMAKAMLGDHHRAITDYDRAIALHDASVPAHVNRGLSQAALGQHHGAVNSFDHALTLDPRCIEALGHRAAAWNQLGDHGKAIADYRRVAELDPQQAEGLNNLAWMLATCPDASLRDGVQAVVLALRATNLRPDPLFFDTLAAAQAANGDFKAALASQDQALSRLGTKADPGQLALLREHRRRYAAGKPIEDSLPPPLVAGGGLGAMVDRTVVSSSGDAGVAAMPALPFSIQVASCREIEAARELTATLRRMGEAAFFVPVELSGRGRWYRILVGCMEKRAAAEVHQNRIKAQGTLDALIVRTPFAVQVGETLPGDAFEKLSIALERRSLCLYGLPVTGNNALLRPLAGAFETQSAAAKHCSMLHAAGYPKARVIRR